jgi:competence protein ComEA
VKRLLAILGAVAVAAVVLLRPVPPPAVPPPAAGGGWSTRAPEPAGRSRGTPPARAMVYVAGDVARPGVYPVGPEARVRDALALAGGHRPDADLVAVNLAAHVRDGDEIVVPVRGAAPAPSARSHGRGRRAGGPRRTGSNGRHPRSHRDAPPPAGLVDINSADAETLATVPGIGPGLAERIVTFRTVNGPFASVDQLLEVSGITEHRLDAMLPYVAAR